MNKDLLAFLIEWITWVDNGAPEGEPFFRSSGLCHNMRYSTPYDKIHTMRSDIKELFSKEGFKNTAYPFGGEDTYEAYEAANAQHLLPARLEWVRKTIKELESELCVNQ